jgi:hypothetical protein
MPKTNSPVFKVKAPSFPRQSAAMQRIEVGEVSRYAVCLSTYSVFSKQLQDLDKRKFLWILVFY